jgi:excisionase family DNA binding protein
VAEIAPRLLRRQKLATLPPVDVHQRYTIDEACVYLRQSPAKTYSDIARGELRVIKDGSRTYIPGSEIVRRSTLPGEAA